MVISKRALQRADIASASMTTRQLAIASTFLPERERRKGLCMKLV
jgi:hypothetical protein